MWPHRNEMFDLMNGKSLKEAWKVLLPYPYMGPFMAYEIITDLRHTFMLRDAPDIMSWCNIGPGARRGLNEIGEDIGCSEKLGLDYMAMLLEQSKDPKYWHHQDWPWEMRTVEHACCEFAKFRHAYNGFHLKRRYNGTDSQKC
jgi:hypothetical protein